MSEQPWCTCGAKTPQGEYHKVGCPARTKADQERLAQSRPLPASVEEQ